MNLLFFTVELERNGVTDRPPDQRSESQSQWRALRWVGLTTAVIICAAAAGCGGWVLAGGDPPVGAAADWLAVDNWFAVDNSAFDGNTTRARLEITSQPVGAAVFVDGRERGATPVSLDVSRATHTLVLRHAEAIDDQRQILVTNDSNVNVNMWRRRPDVVQLRPTYPGASISDAVLLADGHLALSMALPVQAGASNTGVLREPWIFDPASGSLQPFDVMGSIPRAAVLAVSPDGLRVAFLQSGQSKPKAGGADSRLDEVWVGARGGQTPVRILSLTPSDDQSTRGSAFGEVEELRDVAWTPDSKHLLVTAQLVAVSTGYPAAPRSRLLLVDMPAGDQPATEPIELVTLPATIVRGSYTWGPDGRWVAFLTQANAGLGNGDFVALCAIDTGAGGAVDGFRYVADLARQADAASLLPVAPVAWAPVPDGRLVYAAATPKITVSNPLGLPMSSGGDPGLFLTLPAGPGLKAEGGRRLGTAAGLLAPAWRATTNRGGADLLALSRSEQGSKSLIIRSVNAVDGTSQNLGIELPPTVANSGLVGARWDLAHGRLLIVAHPDGSSAGGLEFWLVQLQTPSAAE